MISQAYSAALRLKAGECIALTELSSAVLPRLLPYFILPPPSENDPEKGRPLSAEEMIFENGRRIGRYWTRKPCLVDIRFLFDALGVEKAHEWAPQIFDTARRANGLATAAATLGDLEGAHRHAFVMAGASGNGIALRLRLGELDDPLLKNRIANVLSTIGQTADQTIVVMDLTEADMSDPQAVAEYMIAAFQHVTEAGFWQNIIVHATSYPEKNPAPSGGEKLLPRNEWIAWRRATDLDSTFARMTMFGDFCADSAKFSFKRSGLPIGHYRYSTPTHWFVVRMDETKPQDDGMREVCRKIVGSDHYAGHAFSAGDAYIAECAAGNEGPGSPTTWRRINTAHHLTRVVADVGVLRGFSVPPLPRRAPSEQLALFGSPLNGPR